MAKAIDPNMIHPEGEEKVSDTEFRKHPLKRDNPWRRPDPDQCYRPDRLDYSRCDPYEELQQRGAKYKGELVEIVDVERPLDISTREEMSGTAWIRTSPFSPIQSADIEGLDPISRRSISFDTKVRVPEFYENEIEHKEELAAACPIDVYCSSVNLRWAWRWKLVSYYEQRPGVRESCDTLIVDSGFNRWGSPNQVLSAAAKMDADWVMATDVTGMEIPYSCPVSYCSEKFHDEEELRRHITECDGRHEGLHGHHLPDEYENNLVRRGHNLSQPSTDDPEIETQTEAAIRGIERFMDRAEEIGCLDKTILPLQPPYDEFLDIVESKGWLDQVNYISLGGLLEINEPEDRIEMMREVRRRVGDEMKIHALAPGTEPVMLRELRDNPDLVDSLDVSTPEQAPAKNKLPDATWSQDKHMMPLGKNISTVRGAFASALALQLAHMLSPLCRDETFERVMRKTESEPDPEPGHEPDPSPDGIEETTISEWANS